MNETLKTLVGQPLDGFTVEEHTEIIQVDLDGVQVESHGCLKDESLAQAFVEVSDAPQYWHPADKEFLRTKRIFVLTNGMRAFRIGSFVEVKLLPEGETKDALQQKARAQISPTVRSLLAV